MGGAGVVADCQLRPTGDGGQLPEGGAPGQVDRAGGRLTDLPGNASRVRPADDNWLQSARDQTSGQLRIPLRGPAFGRSVR